MQLFDPSTLDQRVLGNGLTAIVRSDRSAPVVAVVTYLKVGYFDEPDDLAGISHVLEHMFFKGTPTRGPGQIAQETKAAGGYLNASTIYDHTSYYTVLPSRSLEDGIAIQSDALLRSVIDADELKRELQVIVQEAKRKLDNPSALATESLYELMFDAHRMRRWRIGTEAFLTSLTREQLWDYYRRFYRGARTIVVVAGDVDHDTTHSMIERYYGGLESGDPVIDRGPAEPARAGFRFRERCGDVVQSHLEIGWHTQPATHEDTPALDLLSVILGQGRASRLYRNVRETGLVTSIGAHNYTPTELGVFQISAELKPETTRAALEAIAGTVSAAAREISQAELERARSILEARSVRRLESMEGQANHLAEWQSIGDWRLADAYHAQLSELQPKQLAEVAERYLQVEQAAVFVYRPKPAPAFESSDLELARTLRAAPLKPVAAPAPNVQPAIAPIRLRRQRIEDEVSFFRTTTGLDIVIKPRRSVPLVTIALAARAGVGFEDASHAGLTSLTARSSIKGTARRSATELALAAEALGSSINPGVGADLLDWSITVPRRHFQTGLDLLLDAALDPSFPDAEVEREKQVTLADLEQLRDDMYRYPLRLFMSAAFPNHAYGYPLEMLESAVRSTDAATLRNWHDRQVRGNSPTVFVVGDVDPEPAAAAVAGALRARTNGEVHAERPVWPASAVQVTDAREKAQTALVVGFPGVDRQDADLPALQVLANTISGLGGRLFEELRSRRSLAYTVTAYPIARVLGGAFIAYIATSPERETEARDTLLVELLRTREELLREDEVERARRYTIGTRQIRAQTNSAQLQDLIHALLAGPGLSELRDFESQIRAVTPERIREVARKYFDEARLVESIVRGTGGAR
ncbi:MAG: pitrilysin family protein [Gemmatimonadota bacterium]